MMTNALHNAVMTARFRTGQLIGVTVDASGTLARVDKVERRYDLPEDPREPLTGWLSVAEAAEFLVNIPEDI